MWELCCSLAMPIDGTMLGNIFEGGGVLQRENFSVIFFLFSFLSLSLFLSLSPSLSLSLSPSLSLSLSCGFALTGCWPM